MPFTSRGKVKRALRIPTAITDHDDLIDGLINGVHASILDDIGGGLLSPLLTSYTQKYDIMSTGATGIRLTKWPVGAIESVYTGTQNGAAGALVTSTDYYVTEEGTLRLQGDKGYWPVGRQNVQVTWTAGFGSVIDKGYLSMELAERLTVCALFNESDAMGKKSEKIGRYGYTMADAGDRGQDLYPAVAARLVARYRSVVPTSVVVP